MMTMDVIGSPIEQIMSQTAINSEGCAAILANHRLKNGYSPPTPDATPRVGTIVPFRNNEFENGKDSEHRKFRRLRSCEIMAIE